MGPRALAASSGLAPGSKPLHGKQQKIFFQYTGVKGACPLGLPPPPGGERGSPSQIRFDEVEMISTEHKKLHFSLIHVACLRVKL